MAAPLRLMFGRIFSHNLSFADCHASSTRLAHRSNLFGTRTVYRNAHARRFTSFNRVGIYVGAGLCVVGGAPVFSYFNNTTSAVSAAKSATSDDSLKLSRMVRSNSDSSGLKLTLYQYQSCPFCCKVRAYLDYHGFSYDVVEVNSVCRSEIRWSKYKKVPIMLCNTGNSETSLQLNDSSLIVSLLESFLYDRSQSVTTLVSYYPVLESKNSRGRTVFEYPNKYFIMFGENTTATDKQKEERQWRQWTDDVLVHTLSPNIYRTPAESLQAFHHFSDVGEWSSTFGMFERLFIIYVGAAAMYFIGKILKRRYKLKDDVRESLYDACNEWTSALHKSGRTFKGGDQPDLADLAVYGVLSAIEGCDAFFDLVARTDISRWYYAVKTAVATNAGQRQLVENRLHEPA